jgi:hypothetical protein
VVGLGGHGTSGLILIRVLPTGSFLQGRACNLRERPTAGDCWIPLRTARLRWHVDQMWTTRTAEQNYQAHALSVAAVSFSAMTDGGVPPVRLLDRLRTNSKSYTMGAYPCSSSTPPALGRSVARNPAQCYRFSLMDAARLELEDQAREYMTAYGSCGSTVRQSIVYSFADASN